LGMVALILGAIVVSVCITVCLIPFSCIVYIMSTSKK
jgi:multisubunit Na+/H+ antiporter MnhC subunit